jgi:pantoate--beta-alanine ligase
VKVLNTHAELSEYRGGLQSRLAFVPTMGALHEGHLELVRQGLQQAETVIASIFVNPAQFAPHEDLDAYPRTLEEDVEKLKSVGCEAVWAPSLQEMYPHGMPTTTIDVGGVSKPLEGEFRPHFFGGVATVVAKLLNQVRPDVAMFGEKDWQQLQVVTQMVKDLDMGVEIMGVGIVRDENGLALSSRNAYLSKEEYKTACHLNRTLFSMAEKIKDGMGIEEAESWGTQELQEAGFGKIDYCAVRDAHTLLPSDHGVLRILAAAWCGKARLIDNVAV